MKIIDTFLFSESHEDDLLFIKFNLENDAVDYWIIQENGYTLQGEKKPLYAEQVLSQDRFKPYLSKVIIASADHLFYPNCKDENINFQRENWQRTLATQFLQTTTDSGYVIVSDVDEAFDFSDKERSKRLFEIIEQNHDLVHIGRMRYWYDYDNRCYLPNIRIPLVKLEIVRGNPGVLGQVRHFTQKVYDAGEEPLAFEYSYVFRNMEDVWRKKCTYAHTNFTEESIKIALECNHWPRPPERGEKLGDNPYDFFETVELNEKNSPAFVRENLTSFKTNIVNPNYKEARKQRYNI